MYYFESPTERQISLVEDLCQQLHITDFPSCSKEFTKYSYYHFIKWALNQPSLYLPVDWEPDGWEFEYWDNVCNNII